MEKYGIVIETDEKYARVKVERESACGGNCASCGMCGSTGAYIKVRNTEKLEKGDKVRVVCDDTRFLKRCAVGYLSLTALMILGGALGARGGEVASFFGAAAALLCGILILRRTFSRDMNIKTEKIER